MLRLVNIVFFFLILQLSCNVAAQKENVKLDDYFSRKIGKAKIIGMQVASIGNGELVWHGSY